ncbi:TolC family protein [Puia sp.]|uniref:TolC family protein n=1 Tax=Puia sp. TaxID=2045100 RepID=UPI002F4165B4
MAHSCNRAAGRLLGFLLLLAPTCPALAQSTTTCSLSALVDSANRHLPLLLEKQALVQSAKAGITEAKHAFLPRLNVVEELSVGSADDVTGPFLPLPGILHSISGSITAEPNYQAVTGNMASLYGEYELVDFGLKSAKINNAKAFAGLSQADLEKERYLVKWQIGKLFFAILRSRYQLAVDAEDLRRYESMLTITCALTGSGVNPGVDSSLARAGLSRTRVNYNEATGALHRLEQQLAYLTGIDHPVISLDTAVANLPVLPMDTAAAPLNPLADYFAKQKQQYSSQADLARKSYLPKVLLGAGGWARGSSIQYNNLYGSAGEGLGYQRFNYLAGLGITYDLFNGIHRRDRLSVIDGQVKAADYALRQQQLQLQTQQRQAEESIRIAQANLLELPSQLHAATDAYHQKEAQYQAGVINLVDLVNASFELFQAQSAYIRTVNDWYTANLDKAAATGNLDQFIQTVK